MSTHLKTDIMGHDINELLRMSIATEIMDRVAFKMLKLPDSIKLDVYNRFCEEVALNSKFKYEDDTFCFYSNFLNIHISLYSSEYINTTLIIDAGEEWQYLLETWNEDTEILINTIKQKLFDIKN